MSLRASAQSAVIWNAGFNIFRDLLQFGSMLVLVRLIAPDGYGQFALVMSVIGFVNLVAYPNFIAHALQVSSESETRFQEHFTAGAVLNGAAFLLSNLLGVLAARTREWAEIAPLLHVMSPLYLLSWPNDLCQRMIERRFDWKRLRLLLGVGTLASTLLSLLMAWLGCGVYSLLVPGMTVSLPFIFDLFLRQGWRPTWEWSWHSYRPAFHFGITRTGSGVLHLGKNLVESTVLASMLGFSSLGVLNRSTGLGQMFCIKVSSQILSALYPILARVDQPGSIRANGLVLQIVTWTTIPAAAGLAAFASPLVDMLYGSRWDSVITLLPAAMLWAVIIAGQQTIYTMLLARGGQKACLFADAVMFGGISLCLYAVLPGGIVPYMLASAAVTASILAVLLVLLVRREAMDARAIARAYLPPILSAAPAWVCGAAVMRGLPFASTHPLVAMFSAAASFAVVFLISLRFGFRAQLLTLIDCLPLRSKIRKCLLLPPEDRIPVSGSLR